MPDPPSYQHHPTCENVVPHGHHDSNDGDLIQGYIIFAPILKPHQEPLLPRYSLDHTSLLLPQLPQKHFPYLLLQITYLGLDNFPHHDIFPTPYEPLLCGGGGRDC